MTRLPRSTPIGHRPPDLPDFVIIGAMKAGTTTLFRWLGSHPDVFLPRAKEPGFFAKPEVWERGMAWYIGLFPKRPPGSVTGEASTSYLSPEFGDVAAKRLHRTIPNVRLICIVRNPEERLRSHYRHQVQRNRENRSLVEAVSEPDSPYVATSCYTRLLQPWLSEFPAEQLLVVTLDDLERTGHPAWFEVLDHLGLSEVAPPGMPFNVTETKARYTPLMRWIYDSSLREPFGNMPRPVRGALRPVLLRNGPTVQAQYAESRAPLPEQVLEVLAAENARLRTFLQRESLPWDTTPSMGEDRASEAHG